jgi:hypothetical protein
MTDTVKILLISAVGIGLYLFYKDNKNNKVNKPKEIRPKKHKIIPFEELPKKIRFWDDLKAAKKVDWPDNIMPDEFRHYEKLVNDKWERISYWDWSDILVAEAFNGHKEYEYRRHAKSENGKFVYYLERKDEPRIYVKKSDKKYKKNFKVERK